MGAARLGSACQSPNSLQDVPYSITQPSRSSPTVPAEGMDPWSHNGGLENPGRRHAETRTALACAACALTHGAATGDGGGSSGDGAGSPRV